MSLPMSCQGPPSCSSATCLFLSALYPAAMRVFPCCSHAVGLMLLFSCSCIYKLPQCENDPSSSPSLLPCVFLSFCLLCSSQHQEHQKLKKTIGGEWGKKNNNNPHCWANLLHWEEKSWENVFLGTQSVGWAFLFPIAFSCRIKSPLYFLKGIFIFTVCHQLWTPQTDYRI